MRNNILKLHRKYTNVVDLHDVRPVLGRENVVIDLRKPINKTNRESFETILNNKLSKEKSKIAARRKKKTGYFSSIYKTLAILLLVSLSGFSLSQVGSTFSIFTDAETSSGNKYIAGVIDFSLTLSPFSNDAWQNLVSGTSTAQNIDVVPNIVSNPFFYYASSTNFVGDDAFCSAINVVATFNGNIQYDGPLTGLLSATTTDIAVWNLEFSNEQKFFNSVCQFDIDFNGWQERHDYPNYSDGYSDTEKTTHTLYSDGLKINKVYFEAPSLNCRMNVDDHFLADDDSRLDRDGRERQDRREYWPPPDRECYGGRGREDSPRNASSSVAETATSTINAPSNEWIELYNQNDEPADIDGWFICDGNACDVLNAPEPIPAFGYALIVGNTDVVFEWVVPDDFVIIGVDDEVIGDGLDNSNDALFLRRPDFFTFDQVNWGVPDPLWPYYVPELWNPGVASTSDGTMMARVPTGFDTNKVTDFKILEIPQIDLLYPGDVVDDNWFWGFTYLITWLANNPNGDDSELLVDIWLIQDTNYSGQIDEGDTHMLMDSKIANDGNQEITVPDGFIGDIWIKVVVTGPENPMTQSRDISGKIYDPIPATMFDDEEVMDVMIQAVTDQINGTGSSEFSHLLIEPVTNKQAQPEENAFASSTPSSEEKTASSTLTIQGSLEEIIEEDVSSTTDSEVLAFEEGSFEKEINGLIEDFVAKVTLEGSSESEFPQESSDEEFVDEPSEVTENKENTKTEATSTPITTEGEEVVGGATSTPAIVEEDNIVPEE